jgi:ABC-type Fe3+/spermidine/putrescine transport system ATPase subunit
MSFAEGLSVPVPADSTLGPATLMVRPEAVSIGPPGSGPASALKGRIGHVAFLGNHTLITVDTAAGALVVHRPHHGGAEEDAGWGRPGEESCLWWPIDVATILARE